MVYGNSRDLNFDWLLVKVLDSTRGPLSEDDLTLVYNHLEALDSKKLESLVSKVGKLASNPSSEGSLRKTVGTYRPRRRRKPRPHRPQRKRGYDDKGTMAPESLKEIRKIQSRVHVTVYLLQDNLPSLLDLIDQYGRDLLSEKEDYVDITGLERFADILEEEGLWTKRAQWELDELIDYVDEVSKAS